MQPPHYLTSDKDSLYSFSSHKKEEAYEHNNIYQTLQTGSCPYAPLDEALRYFQCKNNNIYIHAWGKMW